MLQLSIKSLEYQRAMLKGGEKFQQTLREGTAGASADEAPQPNPAIWAWDLMARAGKDALAQAQPPAAKPKRKRAKG